MKKVILAIHSHYFSKIKVFDANYSISFGFLNHYFKNNYYVLRHSLYNNGESRVYNDGINRDYYKVPIIGKLSGVLRYISEVIFNFFYLLPKTREGITFIGLDPLSCFSASLLKKIGFNITVLFITPDYAEKRFDNKILNYIYFKLDKFCLMNCDKNICCSEYVIEYKKKKYNNLDLKDKFFHMPNIPSPWVINKYIRNKKIEGRIIYIGNISSQIDFIKLIDTLNEIKKRYQKLNLILVGSGDKEQDLIKYAKEKGYSWVQFLGNLPQEKTLQEISKSQVGIALYNGTFNYDKFRDSCKIREYQAFGVIPITTDIVISNTDEIKKFGSGLIIKNSPNEIKKAIIKIYSNKLFKEKIAKNCIKNNDFYKDKYTELYLRIKK